MQGEIFLVILGFISTLVGMSLLIWSFKALGWTAPLLLMVFSSLIAGVLINNKNLIIWRSLEPFLDCIVIAGGICVWTLNNPF